MQGQRGLSTVSESFKRDWDAPSCTKVSPSYESVAIEARLLASAVATELFEAVGGGSVVAAAR